MEQLLILALVFGGIVFGFVIGKLTENRHLASLNAREQAARAITLDTFKAPRTPDLSHPPALVCGEAVIASDNFKTWIWGFVNIFGGESKTFSRLYVRARREATLRMIAEAQRLGCNAVCNIRYASSDINGAASSAGQKTAPMATCLVTGTAYRKA